jgi:hypothetical protein
MRYTEISQKIELRRKKTKQLYGMLEMNYTIIICSTKVSMNENREALDHHIVGTHGFSFRYTSIQPMGAYP